MKKSYYSDLRFNFTTSCKKEVTTKKTVIHSDGTVTSELDTDVDYLDLDNSERGTVKQKMTLQML
jgi:hypothetical protein